MAAFGSKSCPRNYSPLDRSIDPAATSFKTRFITIHQAINNIAFSRLKQVFDADSLNRSTLKITLTFKGK
jgi:hypothetical protein